MSKRGDDWKEFAEEVHQHIEGYTVPQYGDKGDDQLTDFTVADCALQVKKYMNRAGRNSRPGQDRLDMLKAAHYCQVAAMLLNSEATE